MRAGALIMAMLSAAALGAILGGDKQHAELRTCTADLRVARARAVEVRAAGQLEHHRSLVSCVAANWSAAWAFRELAKVDDGCRRFLTLAPTRIP